MRRNAKHPLQSAWTLAFGGVSVPGERKASRSWQGSTRHALPAFAFVEDLWALWAQLAPPSRWNIGTTAYLFRESTQPSWEAWPSGGTWTLTFERSALSADAADATWMHLVLAAVGEQLASSPNEVCGVEYAVRKAGVRVNVWTRDAADASRQREVVARLRRLCSGRLPADATWTYIAHDERKRQQSLAKSGQLLPDAATAPLLELYTELRSEIEEPLTSTASRMRSSNAASQ